MKGEDTNTEYSYIWDGMNLVYELYEEPEFYTEYERVYVYGINLIKSYVEQYDSSVNEHYYFYNSHGDVTGLVSAFTGYITKNYQYDAFGNEKSPSGNDMNPFRYCGEYFDKETETYYLRARYYDPKLGRFLCEDPIWDGLNWYTYCMNNPVMYVDPTGLCPHDGEFYESGNFEGLPKYNHDCNLCISHGEYWVTGADGKSYNLRDPRSFFEWDWTGEHVTDEFLAKVIEIANLLFINPDDLMAVMYFESGLNPAQKNNAGGSAIGLIQFTQISLNEIMRLNSEVQITLNDLLNMSAVEQLDYVYLHIKSKTGKMETLSDVYMAVLCPTAVGKLDSNAIYLQGTNSYKQNKTLDINKDGKITKIEATQFVINKRDRYIKKK